MDPPRMTLQYKHYCIKYHWFRDQLEPNNIQLYKIDSGKQLGGILLKVYKGNHLSAYVSYWWDGK